jgi:biotin-dependent carboxylase-like uncharacterized protein
MTSRLPLLLHVDDPGRFSSVQDLGRPGQLRRGVGVSGAADRGALRLANRLVGNPEGAAAVESLLGGLRVRTSGYAVVAVTGPDADVLVDGRRVGGHATLSLPPGARLSVGTPGAGLRTYLAVRGGIAVPPVLGSRSYDTLAELGPPPLSAGDRLPVGDPPATLLPEVDVAPRPRTAGTGPVRVEVADGPHPSWFTAPDVLVTGSWSVSAQADRVGVWLDGPPVERRREEVATEGMCAGAVEVTPDGRVCVFLADHPITGGYPVVGVVPRRGLDALSQARPGRPVVFRRVG